jgi:glycosyltransferase involved in cell wall biosynthesis
MLERKKKIALVHDTIFPFTKGGAQKRFYEIGRKLSQDGYDVHLYGMKSWPGADIIQYEGMTIHKLSKNYPLYTKSGRRSIYQAIMFGLASFRLWREPFDIMDCCGFPYFSIFPARLITWARRKPLYSTWHEVWGYDYWIKYLGAFGIIGFAIERLAAILPDTIISVSDSTTRALESKLGQKNNIVTVPNGINLESIASLSPSNQNSDVIFAGRLTAYKNVDVLIRSIGIIAKTTPEISLLVIGEGPEKEKLIKLTKELSLGENIRFMGFVEKEEDLHKYMMASKVFVLPSEREGFGIVVLEANACGLPVITIDHPHNAAKDLIEEGINGNVIKRDEYILAETITRILQTRETLNPKQDIYKYDWRNITNEIKQLLV